MKPESMISHTLCAAKGGVMATRCSLLGKPCTCSVISFCVRQRHVSRLSVAMAPLKRNWGHGAPLRAHMDVQLQTLPQLLWRWSSAGQPDAGRRLASGPVGAQAIARWRIGSSRGSIRNSVHAGRSRSPWASARAPSACSCW